MEKIKKRSGDERPPQRINLYLGYLVRLKGTKKEIAKTMEISAAGLGNYINTGRDIPGSFLTKWQEVYGNNLIEESKAFDPNDVSHETKINKNKHLINDGEYVGLHRLAWVEFQKTLQHSRKTLTEITKNNTAVTENNTKLTDNNNKLTESIAELVKSVLRQSGGNQQG